MKRKDLSAMTPLDPDQMMIDGITSVSMGERLGWLAEQPIQPRRAPISENRGVMDIYGPIYGYICTYGYLWI